MHGRSLAEILGVFFSYCFRLTSLFLHITTKISGMNEQTLVIMRRLLRPASAKKMAESVRQSTTPGSCEQLTLADAGLEDEVREVIRRRKSRGGESQP